MVFGASLISSRLSTTGLQELMLSSNSYWSADSVMSLSSMETNLKQYHSHSIEPALFAAVHNNNNPVFHTIDVTSQLEQPAVDITNIDVELEQEVGVSR